MENKKTKLSALLLLGIGFNHGYAQQATTASGGDGSGSGGSVAYSVGEIAYDTINGSTGSLAQGVQQSNNNTATLGLEKGSIKLDLSVYPNPTTNYLTLVFGTSTALSKQSMSYQLYDISGKLLENNAVLANSTTIKMEQLPTGLYFLKVTQNDTLVKTFKIIKN